MTLESGPRIVDRISKRDGIQWKESGCEHVEEVHVNRTRIPVKE